MEADSEEEMGITPGYDSKSGGSDGDEGESAPCREAQAEDPEMIRKAGRNLVNNDNIEGTGSDDEYEHPTEDEGEEDLIVTGSKPCKHPALIEGSRQVPPTTRPRLVTNAPMGTDSSED